MPYTLLDQNSLDTAMKKCIEHCLLNVLGSPFASGLLTKKNPNVRYNYGSVPANIRARAIKLQECCASIQSNGCSVFPLFHPAVVLSYQALEQRIKLKEILKTLILTYLKNFGQR